MKKSVMLAVMAIFTFAAANVVSAADCPQERKTAAAPAAEASKDETGAANADHGKELFLKTAKPMACMNCHGAAGDGEGIAGKSLKPKPRNFTCAATMKDISAGQAFYIIKNGSPPTGMIAHGKTLSDKDIWDLVKYVKTLAK